MYTKKTKRGSSEKSTLSNQLITARNLRLKIKQLVEKEKFFELEPVEVLKVYPTGSTDDMGYIDYGRIVGRYVVSEQGLPFEECKDFFPLDTNVLQYPLEGEVVVGFEFNKERYYFATLNSSPKDITYKKRISDVRNKDKKDERDENLKYFENTTEYKTQVKQGDTLIQGRNNNYVKLSSDDGTNSGNIVLSTNDKQVSKNITDDKSFVRMTTKEEVDYSNQVKEFGKSMKKNMYRGKDFLTNDYDDGQIYIGSDRLVFSAETDDIAIFAKDTVHIKGGKGGVQISNRSGKVITRANTVVEDFKDGTKVQLNQPLGGDVILAPEGMKEMGQLLAKQVEFNIDYIKDQIASLIPAAIPGTMSVPSPNWFNNIRSKIKTAEKLKEYNDMVFKLGWLDKTKLKTYTMEELKEAFKPIPGFSNIIEGMSSLSEFKNKVDDIKNQIDSKIEQTKSLKTQALTTVSSTIDSVKNTPNKMLGPEKVEQLKQNLEDFEQEGNDINTYKGAPQLKSRITEYEEAKLQLDSSFGDERITAQKQFEDKEERLRNHIILGDVNSFDDKIIEIDTEVTSLEGSKTLTDSFSNLQTEIEE
jgi:hypothetical protein